jgi:transposase
MQARKELTFERNLDNLDRKTQKSLKKLKAIEFACEPDAKQAAEQWITANPKYIFQGSVFQRHPGKPVLNEVDQQLMKNL